MSPEMKLLRAFIDCCGTDIQDLPGENFKVTRRQKKKRTAKEINYDDDFLALWKIYPKRAGQNPKLTAYKAYSARCLENEPFSKMLHGLQRYAKYIEATDKLNTEYVLQGSTFFGPSKRYLEEWDIPKKKLNKEEREAKLEALKALACHKMPDSLDIAVLRSFAIEHDYKQPGEIKNINDMLAYKAQLKGQIDARINKEL